MMNGHVSWVDGVARGVWAIGVLLVIIIIFTVGFKDLDEAKSVSKPVAPGFTRWLDLKAEKEAVYDDCILQDHSKEYCKIYIKRIYE